MPSGLTSSEIFVGLGLLLALAVGCQIVATTLRLPAIVLLLPVGFVAGGITDTVDPTELFGSAFSPMVSLAVAVILFEGGLDLQFKELEGHSQRVVRRLLLLGVPITWMGAGLLAGLLLGLSSQAAVMLGAIVIVSGPTVVAPLLELARPGRRLTAILGWESTTIDPIGAIIGTLVFQALTAGVGFHVGTETLEFARSVGVGAIGGAVGTALLWLLLHKLELSGVLATEATLATVVAVAAACNAWRDDTGLIAAIVMGVALANLPGVRSPEDRPFFRTIVQLIVGLLFISISATVTPSSVLDVLWPTVALVAGLVVVVRPIVAALATLRTSLSGAERVFIGLMDPRGIVAASTASTFAAPLAEARIGGADDLLPITFLVIVGTVTLYGLAAVPAARILRLTTTEPKPSAADDGPAEPPPFVIRDRDG
jgi:NhaP-type Na+/H+ or K+/H+ antiporter